MKKYQKLLVFTLFCYTLFSINWYRDFNITNIKLEKTETELTAYEADKVINYKDSKIYYKNTEEYFKYYKSVIPGIINKTSFNDKKVFYTSKIK